MSHEDENRWLDPTKVASLIAEHQQRVQDSESWFDRFALTIAKSMEVESELVGTLMDHRASEGSAREAIVEGVLRRILPSSYEIGTGEIVDGDGNHSNQIDIVIARPDFPVFRMPKGLNVYLAESVVATIEVKTRLTAADLRGALDNCASVGSLSYALQRSEAFYDVFKNNGFSLVEGTWRHDNPMKELRIEAIQKPATFIYGFEGYEGDYAALAKVIDIWIEKNAVSSLTLLPSAVAAKGVWARRNAAPFKVEEPFLMLAGPDPRPLRVLILQVLYELALRMPNTADRHGLTPNIHKHLAAMTEPIVAAFFGRLRT